MLIEFSPKCNRPTPRHGGAAFDRRAQSFGILMTMRSLCSSLPPCRRTLGWLLALLALGGCATGSNPKDPLEPFNRKMFAFNDSVDRAVLKPVAKGYQAAVPLPVRGGLDNFLNNLRDVPSAANSLLQGKIKEAAQDTGRFLVNTSIGILGFFDVASRIGLPRHSEDFGQTMGYWGVGPGPYLVLPLLGPSSVRDTGGLAVDLITSPSAALLNEEPQIEAWLTALRIVSARAALLDTEKLLDEAAIDRYSFVREAYLQRRENLINDGASSFAPMAPAPKPRKTLKELEEELDADPDAAPPPGKP